mmetsp:Transcript_38939/g.97396  ORF Transcript_38939/g.97396 Transcript_38939/m.97396 type:complete len:256 (-) Transcript_38939:1153-1920(-)
MIECTQHAKGRRLPACLLLADAHVRPHTYIRRCVHQLAEDVIDICDAHGMCYTMTLSRRYWCCDLIDRGERDMGRDGTFCMYNPSGRPVYPFIRRPSIRKDMYVCMSVLQCIRTGSLYARAPTLCTTRTCDTHTDTHGRDEGPTRLSENCRARRTNIQNAKTTGSIGTGGTYRPYLTHDSEKRQLSPTRRQTLQQTKRARIPWFHRPSGSSASTALLSIIPSTRPLLSFPGSSRCLPLHSQWCSAVWPHPHARRQ